MTKSATFAALPVSTQLIQSAVIEHIDRTSAKIKEIAINAGVKSNYLSMLTAGTTRASIARVAGLKRALPSLDEHVLAAAILGEMFDTKPFTPDDTAAALQTIVDLMDWYATQPDLETELLAVMAATRENAGSCGLTMPEKLSGSTLMGIQALIDADVQRATQAEYDAVHG